MNKKIIWGVLFSLFITLHFPAFVDTQTIYAADVLVTGDTVNIRTGPGLSYDVVTKVKKNEALSVLSEDGDWLKVKTSTNKVGWIANWLIQSKQTTVKKNQTAKITENGLRVRSAAGATNKVLGTLQKGETYDVLLLTDGWIQIDSPFGKGWVSKDFATILEVDSSTNSYALNQVETPTVQATGMVTTSILNVRSIASTNSTIIGKLQKGAIVSIISQTESWTTILYNGNTAYVSSQYIEKSGNISQEVVENIKVQIIASVLKVRSSNQLDAKEVGRATKDQIFNVLDEKNDWIQIEYEKGKTGWIAGWYTQKITDTSTTPSTNNSTTNQKVTILNDGTNIRKEASTSSTVVYRASKGNQFDIIEKDGDWYKISLTNGQVGYVAGWIISINGNVPVTNQTATTKSLANKTIVVDAGHGGRDSGTIGISGTKEKAFTLTVAKQLQNALKAAGANVIMTRTNDTYISLANRVYLSSYHQADAFISIHFDSINDSSVRGLTTYYYHPSHQKLASSIHQSVVSATSLKNRSTRNGNYYVLRENFQPAVLLELGYLSNKKDEALIQTASFQANAVNGIVKGLTNYFQ